MAPGGQTLRVGGHDIKIANLDKVLYPATGTTKSDVLHYYAQVAPYLIAHAANRPATRKRWPDGVRAKPFFEKNLPSYAPDWIATATLQHSDRLVRYPLINDPATLLWLVQGAALELHVPQWTYDVATKTRRRPDRLVIDLDPGEPAGLTECATVALAARELLAADGLDPVVPVTSGSKGMQLYAALTDADPADSNAYARDLARRLTSRLPDLALYTMAKADRTGKIFIDWSQNNPAKTTITPYSLRGREQPFVATPRKWSEVEQAANGSRSLTQLQYPQVLERLAELGDLFTLV